MIRGAALTAEDVAAASEDVNEIELAQMLREELGLELQMGCIGKGSSAAVFKAVSLGNGGTSNAAAEDGRGAESLETLTWQGEAGKVFAVKVLLASAMDAESSRDFRREAALLGRVDHPGIIQMHHYEKSGPQPFMVTEFCGGGNLWNAIHSGRVNVNTLLVDTNGGFGRFGNMPLLDVPSIAEDISCALAYLHTAGFAHRDIKTSNVLLTWCPNMRRVRAKLCDFGSAAPVSKMPRRPAKPQWGGFEKWLGFTGQWQPVGTMLWMAPEMLEPPVEGSTPPPGYSGDKVDVYSLGVVLWELMEWRVPWAGGLGDISKQEVIDSVVCRGERLPIPDGCNSRLADLLSSMWASSPDERPSAGLVVAELERVGPLWDTSGQFERVAMEANARGEELAHLLAAASTAEILKQELVPFSARETRIEAADEEIDDDASTRFVEGGGVLSTDSDARSVLEEELTVSAEDADPLSESGYNVTAGMPSAEELQIISPTSSDTSSPTKNSRGGNRSRRLVDEPVDHGDASSSEKVESQREPNNWLGEVGSVSLTDLKQFLVPTVIFPTVFGAVVSDSEVESLKGQRSELAELERGAQELRARSKMDPFAAFTAGAKESEARRLQRRISLAEAQGQVKAWRTTRDVLRE
eukprot:CAMPEP_0197611240 /NCGR_PEP_ID=MMETSP1326-20131121/54977_1 /TAXON_ID=1155430 /ORGANISM="Genus nov. species nov., Strain RCC2288" /LENGTH=637 /DNA_ID=CAMNT_0043179865 /DNA_START=223 /DNA_END=2133 /DNA_ORIENTATION=+